MDEVMKLVCAVGLVALVMLVVLVAEMSRKGKM